MPVVSDALSLLVLAAGRPDAVVVRKTQSFPGDNPRIIALHVKCATAVFEPLFFPTFSPGADPTVVITCFTTKAEHVGSAFARFHACLMCHGSLCMQED